MRCAERSRPPLTHPKSTIRQQPEHAVAPADLQQRTGQRLGKAGNGVTCRIGSLSLGPGWTFTASQPTYRGANLRRHQPKTKHIVRWILAVYRTWMVIGEDVLKFPAPKDRAFD